MINILYKKFYSTDNSYLYYNLSMPFKLYRLTIAIALLFIFIVHVGQAHATLPRLNPPFFWGVSTAGYQIEGHNQPTNWEMLSISKTGVPVGNADDFFTHYSSDIDRARDLGVNVFRMSVEWSRLQPSPTFWDPQGFAFYDRVINKIVADKIRPMITLDHWTYPRWAYEQGGWKNPQIIRYWLNYAHKVVERYAHFHPLWVTFNEPQIKLLFETVGNANTAAVGDAFTGPTASSIPVVLDNLVTAHTNIYQYIHHAQPDALVTTNTAYTSDFENIIDDLFYNRIINSLDFIGIDYYYGHQNPRNGFKKPWLNELQTEGIYYALRHYHVKYPQKPLYIVENGMPTDNEHPRSDGYTRNEQLQETIYWIQRAVADGIPVIGYNYWSLIDNYEWGSYSPRFGLYTVNVKTDPLLRRIPTNTVAVYRTIIIQQGIPDDYVPTHKPVACSQVDYPLSCTKPVTL